MTERRTTRPRAFFDEDEQRQIVAAIEAAERRTSAEIRVHLEHDCEAEDPTARAIEVFETLGMTRTAARNGVLIYFATGHACFAVVGDRGIDTKVDGEFWSSITSAMQDRFVAGDHVGGTVEGIRRIGEALAAHFPHAGTGDLDELDDEISFG